MQSDDGSPSSSQESPSSLLPTPLPVEEVFSITREDAAVLAEYVEEFQEGDADLRNTIIANAMAELSLLRPDTSSLTFNKADASKKIRKWFYNHYSQPKRQYVKFTRKWSARNTFYHMSRDEVMKEAEDMSGAEPGSQAFLGSLQDATTKLWKRLSESDQQTYAKLAKRWSEEAPPRIVQSRMANSIRAKIVRDFQTQLYRTCGVRCIVLSAYAHEDGKIMAGIEDSNKSLDNGTDFTRFCPDWQNAPLFREWQKYAKMCFKGGDVETTQRDRSKTNTTPITIQTKSNGRPKVPAITAVDGYKTKVVQAMLRDYCTTHIRYTSGKKRATIPWAALCKDPSSWIMPECAPDEFQWADPSKIRIGDIFSLLECWRTREANGLRPLIWAPSCPLLQDVETHKCASSTDGHSSSSSSSSDAPGTSPEGFDLRSADDADDHSETSALGYEEQADFDFESPPLPGSPSQLEGSESSERDQMPASPVSMPGRHRSREKNHSDNDSSSERTGHSQESKDDSSDLSDHRTKRQVKMTDRARNMDAGRGVGKLNARFLQR